MRMCEERVAGEEPLLYAPVSARLFPCEGAGW